MKPYLVVRQPAPFNKGRMYLSVMDHLIPFQQLAIGSMILFSGVDLFLLTLTNRLGRLDNWSKLSKS
jgi:hypothetical protein